MGAHQGRAGHGTGMALESPEAAGLHGGISLPTSSVSMCLRAPLLLPCWVMVSKKGPAVLCGAPGKGLYVTFTLALWPDCVKPACFLTSQRGLPTECVTARICHHWDPSWSQGRPKS